jgi:putative OPT family oligopeptide transporter
MTNNTKKPFISADQNIAEFTIKATILGILIGLVMTAANIYLGLKAGMTIGASIPAAVLSMGILRGVLRRGTILENNIVQSIASAGESLAAGIIFTVPALVIAGVWETFNLVQITIIALLGGTIGVLMMIPLRRSLIVDNQDLIYPEGVACAEVLEAGEKGGRGFLYVFQGLGLGALFKFLASGFGLVKGTLEGAIGAGKSILYFGSDMSAALMGVGYIVGFNIATLVFAGGTIAWLIGIPILAMHHPGDAGVLEHAWFLWDSEIRYMGVGAMVVGGLWSIIKIRSGIMAGIKDALNLGQREDDGTKGLRTYKNISTKWLWTILILTLIPTFAFYIHITSSTAIGVVSGVYKKRMLV